MKFPPETFVVSTSSVERVVGCAKRRASGPQGTGLLFLSGALTGRARDIARGLLDAATTVDWLIVCGAGVVTERGELEGVDAAAGIILKTPARILVSEKPNAAFGQTLAQELSQHPGSSAQVFIRSDRIRDDWIAAINASPGSCVSRVFAGGVLPNCELLSVRGGKIETGEGAAIVFGSNLRVQIASSSACRMISPLGRVTKMRGATLLEIDGDRALDRLSEHARAIRDGSLILFALGDCHDALGPGGRKIALRAIEGVDPERGAIVVGDDISEGARIGFAVRDPHSARRNLEAHLKSLGRACAGGAPSFGIYCCCAGRGRRLYERGDVDSRLIRTAFPGLPFLGLHSTFEVAPLNGRLVPQVFAGVLAIFNQPS